MLKENLSKIMELKRISGVDLSKMSGVPQSRISDIVTGRTKNPRVETLKAISLALNVSVAELTGEVVPEINPVSGGKPRLTQGQKNILDLLLDDPEGLETMEAYYKLPRSQRKKFLGEMLEKIENITGGGDKPRP